MLESDEPLRLRRTRSHRDARLCNQTCAIDLYNGRNHGDRNHQVASGAEFQKADAASSSGRGTITLLRISSARRKVFRLPTMKSRKRNATRSRGRNQFDFGVERKQRRHTVGGRGRIAKIAGDGASILNLNRANFAGGALQRVEATGQRSGNDFAPGGQPADAD